MKIQERQQVRGSFMIRIYTNGVLTEEYRDDNLIVDMAKVALTRLVAGEVTGRSVNRIAVGTRSATPIASDVAITSPFVKNIDSHSYPATGQVTFHWSLASTEANGKAISEFGLLCADGALFARKTRTEPINKASDITIDGQWTLIF